MKEKNKEWISSASQERSRETEQKIRKAAIKLLRVKAFDELKMTDITTEAGVAIGTLYRRFRDKKALLNLIHEELLNSLLISFDKIMSDKQMEDKKMDEVAQTWIAFMIKKFRKDRKLFLAVRENANIKDEKIIATRTNDFNQHVHSRLKELFIKHEKQIKSEDPERTIYFAIFISSATAREAVIYNRLKTYPIKLNDKQLINEITNNFMRYLCH